MKILVKNHKPFGVFSLVMVDDFETQKKVLRFLSSRNYRGAIKYLLRHGDEIEVFGEEPERHTARVDVIVTPRSVHWDLVG